MTLNDSKLEFLTVNKRAHFTITLDCLGPDLAASARRHPACPSAGNPYQQFWPFNTLPNEHTRSFDKHPGNRSLVRWSGSGSLLSGSSLCAFPCEQNKLGIIIQMILI